MFNNQIKTRTSLKKVHKDGPAIMNSNIIFLSSIQLKERDANKKGELIYNVDDNNLYYSNGKEWKSLKINSDNDFTTLVTLEGISLIVPDGNITPNLIIKGLTSITGINIVDKKTHLELSLDNKIIDNKLNALESVVNDKEYTMRRIVNDNVLDLKKMNTDLSTQIQKNIVPEISCVGSYIAN